MLGPSWALPGRSNLGVDGPIQSPGGTRGGTPGVGIIEKLFALRDPADPSMRLVVTRACGCVTGFADWLHHWGAEQLGSCGSDELES